MKPPRAKSDFAYVRFPFGFEPSECPPPSAAALQEASALLDDMRRKPVSGFSDADCAEANKAALEQLTEAAAVFRHLKSAIKPGGTQTTKAAKGYLGELGEKIGALVEASRQLREQVGSALMEPAPQPARRALLAAAEAAGEDPDSILSDPLSWGMFEDNMTTRLQQIEFWATLAARRVASAEEHFTTPGREPGSAEADLTRRVGRVLLRLRRRPNDPPTAGQIEAVLRVAFKMANQEPEGEPSSLARVERTKMLKDPRRWEGL